LASLYNTLGGVFWQWGDFSEASHYVQDSLELYRDIGYAWGMANAYTNLGVLHDVQGLWPQAADFYERALALRRENGYLPEQALNLTNLGLLRIAMGDHVQARQGLKASLALGRRLGDDFGVVMAQVGLAQLAVIQSRFEDAASSIQAVLDMPDAAGKQQTAHALRLWGLVQAERDDLESGLASAERALALAQGAGLTATEADCRRVLGILRARAGDHLEAELQLHESIDLCNQVNAPYNKGLALLELGRMYLNLARTDGGAHTEWRAKALTALAEAVGYFDLLGAAHDLDLARALLRQIPSERTIKSSPAPGI
jgi:tetratricopeptide (TPR) repeat protein